MVDRAAPRFFDTASAFGAWLAEHGGTETALVVGFHKRATGTPCMTWSESVDEALCHGWIDGVRARIDDASYRIRFTPRKASSIWSAVNLEKMRVLEEAGRVTAAGRAAFAARRASHTKVYAYEQAERAGLAADDEAAFRRHAAAWRWFEGQPPWYRHLAAHRIASAKKPETRARRLAALIAAAANGTRI